MLKSTKLTLDDINKIAVDGILEFAEDFNGNADANTLSTIGDTATIRVNADEHGYLVAIDLDAVAVKYIRRDDGYDVYKNW